MSYLVIDFSGGKGPLIWIRREIFTDGSTVYKQKQSKTDFDVKGQQGMDFSTEGSNIMNFRLVFWP